MTTTPVFERHDDVLWWMANPDESLARSSLVLDTASGQIAIDPVDCDGLDEEIESIGGLDGVAVLMDRHSRDAKVIADRHEVPLLVPEGADRIEAAVNHPVEPLDAMLAESEYQPRWVVSNRFWEEVCLWCPPRSTLVIPESLGTAATFTVINERIGVHPLMRIKPPRGALAGIRPERLFVGHGRPLYDVKPDEIDTTLTLARRRLPRAWVGGIVALIKG